MSPQVHALVHPGSGDVIDEVEWNRAHYDLFSVKKYGALGDGTTNDRDAIQNAINAAVAAGGGDVVFPAGSYRMLTDVSLPVGLAGKLRIYGDGPVTLIPSTGCFFHRGGVDTVVRNIEISNLRINGANATGQYAMIGSYVGGGHGQHKGWDGLYIHDIEMYDLPHNPWSGTNHIWGLGLTTYHTNLGETLTEINNITVERVHVRGGNAGFIISGHRYGTDADVNIKMDNIVFRDCSYIAPTAPAEHGSSSGFHVGQYATIGKIRMYNCHSVNSADNGIEINAAQDCIIDGCWSRDCFVAGVTIGPYTTMQDTKTARYVVSNCSDEWTKANPYEYHYAVVCLDEAREYGTIIVENLRVKSRQRTFAFAFGTRSAERIVLRDIFCDYDFDETLTGSVFPTCVSISDNGTGHRHLIDGLHIICRGTVTAGAYQFGWKAMAFGGPDVNFTVRNTHLDWQVPITPGWKYFYVLGASVGSYTGALVDGCSLRSTTDTASSLSLGSSNANNTLDTAHTHVLGDNLWVRP